MSKNIVGVRFRKSPKIQYADAGELKLSKDEAVIISVEDGEEFATVVSENGLPPCIGKEINDKLCSVARAADREDIALEESHVQMEKEAFGVCVERIAEHGLDMNLVDVYFRHDEKKITFYFIADSRIDFRDLVKDLAGIFRRRIELRQIGVRDQAKMNGGIGVCGREFCCSGFLKDFCPVSVKMAKTQNLALNPSKISGCCGRLMCCLSFEHEAYEEARKRAPKQGALVRTPDGEGKVTHLNLLKETATVRFETDDAGEDRTYSFDEIKFRKQNKNPETKDKAPNESRQ